MPVMKVGPGRALLGGGGNYNDLVMGTRPIAYWPLDESAGTVARCLVNTAQNGTYTGVTLANDNTGPFGTPAPWYDGATSYLNAFSAALAAAFNGAEGTIIIWAKVNAVGVWTDGVEHRISTFRADINNRLINGTNSLANQLRWAYRSGGVFNLRDGLGYTTVDWFMHTITWSKALDEVRAFHNGAQVGATMNGLGVWAGALANTTTVLGSASTVPANSWHGWLGPSGIWGRALPPAEVLDLYVV